MYLALLYAMKPTTKTWNTYTNFCSARMQGKRNLMKGSCTNVNEFFRPKIKNQLCDRTSSEARFDRL